MDIKIRISSRGFVLMQLFFVTATLGLCSLVSAVAGISGHRGLLGFARLFDVGHELSIATFVSTLNLMLAAGLLYFLYKSRRETGSEDYRCWQLLSVLFLWLAIDESISIHENFAKVYRFLVERGWFPSILDSHQWLPFGVLFVIVTAAVVLPQLRKVNSQTVRLMFLAGIVFLIGAIGFEYLGALMLETEFVASKNEPIYIARRIFEEGFEMYGIVIFNWAIYREIMKTPAEVTLKDPAGRMPYLSVNRPRTLGFAANGFFVATTRPRRTPSP